MEAIALVEHLRELTINPQNRATIVKDKGCLAGLVLFLDNSDVLVVHTALQALKNLAKHRANISVMKNELGMLESLRAIIHRNGEAKTKQLASDVYDTLTQTYELTRKTGTTSSGRGNKPVLSNNNRKSKTYILQITGLNNQITKRVCEEQLLTIRGIISFTFNMAKCRCIVRARPDITSDSICMVINKTKILNAQQVIKNDKGEEVLLPVNSCEMDKSQHKPSSKSSSKENAVLPDYLPEDDELVSCSKSVLARVDQSDGKENQGWFGSVGSFISKTLYW